MTRNLLARAQSYILINASSYTGACVHNHRYAYCYYTIHITVRVTLLHHLPLNYQPLQGDY